MKTIIPVILGAVIFFGVIVPKISEPGIAHSSGQLAPEIPKQVNISNNQTFELQQGVLLQRLAKFKIEALVLNRKRYYFDKTSKISPVDLALGWGPMSDGSIVKDIKISQNMRWYYWRTQDARIPMKRISLCSANMHIIPANKHVRKQLLKVRKGHIVEITGYLVFVKSPKGWEWKSSMTRKDTGNHACEVVWAEALSYY